MQVALIVGILFFAGALYNLFGPEPDLAEASAGLTIAAVLIGVFRFSYAAKQKDEQFLSWLLTNAREIYDGGVSYGSVLITPATVLTRYQAALSFLIVSFKVPSRSYIEGQPAPLYVPILLSMATLVLGWWGIPWGPVYTIQVLARNVRGGAKETVGDMLESANNQIAGAS